MAVTIKMPPLSQTTDTVILTEWLVREGDMIEKGQPIADVETDKVSMQVESFTAGSVIRLVSAPGDEIPVGEIIAYIGDPGEEVHTSADVSRTSPVHSQGNAPPRPAGNTENDAVYSSDAPSESVTGITATPLVKSFAEKRGVDLTRIQGSGPKGLIVKADVMEFLTSGSPPASSAPAFTERQLNQNQRAIAANLTRSAREIPHYYLRSTLYLDALLNWREINLSAGGGKVSLYSPFIYAAARTMRDFPDINGFCEDNRHFLYKEINIAFAVSSGTELHVPVIKQADTKSVAEIDREVRLLTDKSRNRGLEPGDIAGGTFTVTNLGIYRIDEFAAMISPGQAGIIALGRAAKKLIADDEERLQLKRCAVLTGSFDHRIVNGARGAEFMDKLAEVLEKEFGNG